MAILPKEYCDLHFYKTVKLWDEAVPLGNGRMGALVWGPSNALRFSLDRGDIWDTTPAPEVGLPEFTFRHMVELAKAGEVDEIRRIFSDPYFRLLPTKLPAGKLILDLGMDENVESTLHLATAESVIRTGAVEVRSFLHALTKLGHIRVNRPLSNFSFTVIHPAYGDPNLPQENPRVDCVNTGGLELLHYPAPEEFADETCKWFVQKVSEKLSYGIFVKAKEAEGCTELVFTVAASSDGENWKSDALRRLDEALDAGYDASFAAHCAWWEAYWGKSAISLPDKYFEKMWYLTNYLFASCSRKGELPMPLQGVWTADNDALPPWKGDYHHDLNTQMSYYHYMKANHMEEGESFVDFLWNTRDAGYRFAKDFYHTDGLCLPAVMALDGTPLGGWAMYSLAPTNQLWLCQAFERHYRFSGDRDFLEQRVYPYCKDTARMILGLLEERDGKLFLPISSSPEIHDDNMEAFVTPNSNYDLSLIRYLFETLVSEAEELNSPKEAARWRGVLDKLPELAVNENHVLRLSPDEDLTESHRHFSHAMSVHPLRQLPYEGDNMPIIDATILELERLGKGAWVGFSFTWMAELYAIQRNGRGAAYQLETFWKYICSQNGFHLNGDYKNVGVTVSHYRPFTLEANFCAADALQEMLLQTENGIIDLFPAIPAEWAEQEVSFDTLRAENGVLVSAKLRHGKVTELTIQWNRACSVLLKKSALLAGMPSAEWQETETGYLYHGQGHGRIHLEWQER